MMKTRSLMCPLFPSPTLQAYTEELVDLHRRLMALRERNVLQQVCVHVLFHAGESSILLHVPLLQKGRD